MRAIRRILQVAAFVGTITVGVLAVALIVSQTPWFRDWLRRYIVRESKQYLNGELAIGGIGGNLLFGAQLSDIAIDVSGERILSVKGLELDYSVFQLVRTGLVLSEIKLDQPYLLVQRDANGLNLGNLVKKQRKEADREGPGRPISLPSIEISDGRIALRGAIAGDGLTLPEEIGDLDVKGGFEYEPVHYSVKVDHVSFRGTSPDFALKQMSGKFAVREDNLYVERLTLALEDTSMTIDGVIEHYLRTPVLNLTTTGHVSLPEIGRVVTAAAGYALHPVVDIKAAGPASALELQLNVRSEAGNVNGHLTADVQAPNFAARGDVNLERLNLAPILKDPSQKTDLTGHATLDLKMASQPATAPVMDRLDGTFAFDGSRVVAAGYEARNVKVSGSLDGSRINLAGRAAAYGGTATAKGFIVTKAPGRALAFDLRGRADNVDLRGLPATTGAPTMATHLSVAEYHVQGQGQLISGTAALNRSTVEGATIADGTDAEFSLSSSTITYGARGSIASLDLQRVGRSLKIAALATPRYESEINGAFDVSGSMPRTPASARRGAAAPSALSTMTLDATGTLTDSTVMGGRLPQFGFEAHLDKGALRGRANGTFENFNPGQIAARTDFEGRVSGSVNANVAVSDLSAPITPDAVTADGTLTLTQSTVGGLEIDSAAIEGKYAQQVGDITRVTVTGPDLKVDASGRLALDRTSQSNLKYHVDAVNLEPLATLAGQTAVKGAATLDGTLTGNAASLATTGTLNGSGLRYAENGALDLNSRYTVTVPDLAFAKATVEATTEATFVTVGGMELNSVNAVTRYADNRVSFTANLQEKTRELDASGEVILHPDHQEMHLPQLALRTQGIEWRTVEGSEAIIKYGVDRIELQNVKLVSGQQSLDISGSIPTGDAAKGGNRTQNAIEVHARNVDLQQLQTLALMERGLSGTLNADAKISGSTASPIVDGNIKIDKGAFQTYHYDSLTADLDYTGTRIGIDATLQQSPTESITAKGTVPMSLLRTTQAAGHVPASGGDQVDLHITSTALNLAAIQAVTSLVTDVTGTLQADVRVTGSGEDPHLNGFIDITGGGFGVPAVGETFTGLTTRIDLLQDVLKIQRFEILDRNGERLAIDGQLAVHAKQAGAVSINVNSDNFELMNNELGDVQVGASIQITGELRRPKVVGNVRLDAGRIEVDRLLQLFYDPYATTALPDVVSAERQVEASGSAEEATRKALARAEQSAAAPGAKPEATEPGAPPGIMDAMELDVRVVLPDNLVLRGKDIRPGGPTATALGDMNITVGGDVQARKSPGGKIALVGTVNTVRGTYEFQGRRFDLQRNGTLRFTGSTQIDPLLDLTATREIPNTGVTARVRITGTTTAPQLALTSDPPLEESDILALIVFNRPVNELGTGERSSLAATAGGIATGFIAAPLGESIGKALDLDLFEITTSTDEGGLGAGVTLGQQIGDRAFVKVRQQFGERSSSQFMIEYQLARFLRLEATGAPETSGSANRVNQRRVERAGIDLIFFFSY